MDDEDDAYSHWTTLGIAARRVVEGNRERSHGMTTPGPLVSVGVQFRTDVRLFIRTGAGPVVASPAKLDCPAFWTAEFTDPGKGPDAEAPGSLPRRRRP